MEKIKLLSPVSPLGLALISYGIFICGTTVPPKAYESVMMEPNFMFLDLATNLFVFFCVFSFFVGAVAFAKFGGGSAIRAPLRRWAILSPLIILIALNFFSIFLLMKNNPNFLLGWFQEASTIKRDFDGSGGLTPVLPMLYGATWWGLWRLLERERDYKEKDFLLRFFVALAFLLAIISSVMKVARTDLMPTIFGFMLVIMIFKYRNSSVSSLAIVSKIIFGGFFLVIIFSFISWLRVDSDVSLIFGNIIGYTISSYNRLSAILGGELSYPYGGSGVYSFRFMADPWPFISRWIDFSVLFGMESTSLAWSSEFPAVYSAGLDGSYIWASAFGYLYSDIGLLTFLYMFVVGGISAVLWRSICAGNVFGVVFYPWVAFSILFWVGDNFIAYPRVVELLYVAVFISIYERLLRVRIS